MALELTGERTVPGVPSENYWFRRHEAAYRFAATCCVGGDVLDAGCGEGYGPAVLAGTARSVVGVDLAGEVCAHATAAYPEAAFVQADLCALPLADACVDAVVSLQVIEHLWDIPRYLDEVTRVLRPGGVFVCSTPNRRTFTPESPAPVNPFHTVELTADELRRLLGSRFTEVDLRGVHHRARLAGVEAPGGATLPALLLACAPETWSPTLAGLVASVTADDFTVSAASLDTSLDLLAVARVGEEP